MVTNSHYLAAMAAGNGSETVCEGSIVGKWFCCMVNVQLYSG